ncbi:cupin domain-containing protein [Christensenellaceae bacterium OttesenSCG-928-L17]|nr:cupin domain-containing protein [Christensenellaceae bacterium OttesenSCG-928-L17]
MRPFIKNIAHATPLAIAAEVSYQPGQIVSKTLSQNSEHSLTLFAFDKGEEISSHSSDGDAMILALDGKGKITIDGADYMVNAGETIVMPAKKPHAVFAEEQFKMLLIVIFS